jgi:sulfur carrier protein
MREVFDLPHGPQSQMTVIVNGQPQQVRAGTTLAQLLVDLRLPQRGIAVEINETVVPRIRHAEQTLSEGDRLEVVSLVGGG